MTIGVSAAGEAGLDTKEAPMIVNLGEKECRTPHEILIHTLSAFVSIPMREKGCASS